MPRDNDNDNVSSRGRRTGGKDRRPAARAGEKKFAKPRFGGKGERDQRPSRGDRDERPYRRRDEEGARPRFRRDDRSGDDERSNRGKWRREDKDARPSGRRSESKPEGRRDAGRTDARVDKRGAPRARDFDRPPRERGDPKPWQRRDDDPRRERRGEDERPRFRARQERFSDERFSEQRPKFGRPRHDRPRDDRSRDDRPRPRGDDRPPRRPEGRNDWQEHPRSNKRPGDRFADRPRRDNEDDSRIFAKRPAFGGRGAYRERKPEFDRRAARDEARPKPKKSGERVAKVVARAGLASRRDAEELILHGRVTVNGRVINSPALDVTANDVVAVDGTPLPARERTRLFLYHKPRGLMTTHADPEGRPTVFDNMPEGLPRLISIGRLDFNTEGLLLLTNDGGLARELELPETGWLRRYRVRAYGEVTQAQLDALKDGVEVDGVKYGPIDATLERDQGANVWLVFAIREGKNREVRNVLAHLGLEVNRLIRVSYGPFQLAELGEGAVDEVKTRVLREQLGDKVIARSGADFGLPEQRNAEADAQEKPRFKKPFKPAGKSALVSDRKGRRVLVQRTGSEEARTRNEFEANGYGPPRRPKRGYHGKRDLKPRDG
jgi:23S rRNA pseudouridine2605 synthase